MQAELLRDRFANRVRDEIRAQADVIRAQAEMQRAEIEQIRLRTRSQFRLARTANRRVTVVCPKTGTRIAVNAGRISRRFARTLVEDSDRSNFVEMQLRARLRRGKPRLHANIRSTASDDLAMH